MREVNDAAVNPSCSSWNQFARDWVGGTSIVGEAMITMIRFLNIATNVTYRTCLYSGTAVLAIETHGGFDSEESNDDELNERELEAGSTYGLFR